MAKNKLEEEALSGVMARFHDFFLGGGLHVGEANVALRNRDDFTAPLVTVLGHTFGIRILDDEEPHTGQAPLCLEASANVYDDEFSVERFHAGLRDTYEAQNLDRLVGNFLTPEEDGELSPDGAAARFEVYFLPVSEEAVELVTKKKTSPSKVTGRFVDKILRVRFRPQKAGWRKLHQDANLFKSVVYLYCLRPFAAAYRKSLEIDPNAAP